MKNNVTRRLLVIGAGIGQVHLVKKARSQGIHVTVLTLPGSYPCIELADDVIYCDVFDREKAASEAKARGIDAVVSDQNDLMTPTVAYIAEKLGLPGNSFEQVQAYCNKNRFRDNCDKLGIPVPKHIAVDNVDFNFSRFDGAFPLIVKPADSQSSVGVRRVENDGELREALAFALSKSFSHTAIVEEFFVGKEIVCEGFIDGGEYRLLAFADRKYFELGELQIPSQTLFPSGVKQELLDRVVECEKKMAAYIKPAFAITHSEYLIDEESNEIRVVESALRGGGVYISSHLIPYATGIDINSVLIDKALNRNVDVEAVFAERKDAAAGYVCFYLPEGEIVSVDGIDELLAFDCVKATFLDEMKPGQRAQKIVHKGLRQGPILVVGKDREELDRNVAKVQQTLKIKVKTDAGAIADAVWR